MQTETRVINLTVKVPPMIRTRLQGLAKLRDKTPHAIMIQAIERYLDREEKRETLRQAGMQAHEDYKRTGLHLTGDEVNTWLVRVMAGERPEMPKCHQ